MNMADAFRANYANAEASATEFLRATTAPTREGIPLGLWRKLPDSETAYRATEPEQAPAYVVIEPYTATSAAGVEVHVPEGARVEEGSPFLVADPGRWKLDTP